MSARKPVFYARARAQRGLSIIELMVGIVVALLVGLAASGSAMMFTASQRQGIGSGGVAVNAATALAGLKNDAALAGLGFFGDDRYLCDTLDLSRNGDVHADGTAFVPVRITEDGTNDRVDLLYAARVEAGANVLVNSDVIAPASSVELRSFLPAAVNDAVLLAPNPRMAAPRPACVVRTVTAVTPSTATTPQILNFDNGGLHNQFGFAVPPSFDDQGQVLLLGTLTWHRYRLVGTNLVMERPLLGDSTSLMRNVMAVRMQYGVSAAVGQTSLDSWQDANGLTFGAVAGADLARVRALRIGVVTRSPQREKENTLGVCEATAAMPQLFGEDIVPDVADWACYRFRTATVVVPLRNLVYGMK